jgi:hypothetical protein
MLWNLSGASVRVLVPAVLVFGVVEVVAVVFGVLAVVLTAANLV